MGRRPRARDLLVAESPPMARVLARVEELSQTDAPVLIEGEPGTGRELIARLIHHGSRRRTGQLVAVSAGAAPKKIFVDQIQGGGSSPFRTANGGSLLVKNLSELSRTSQRMLRQELNPSRPRDWDVRILTTSDPDLEGAVEAEMFNRKLFGCLAENRIVVPPLRERLEDIRPLCVKLIGEYARELGKKKLRLSSRAFERMAIYPWPGNVAELKQLCRRLVFRTKKSSIDVADVDALLPLIAERVPLEDMSFEEMVKSQISAFLRRVDGYDLDGLYDNVIGRVERPLLELVMERTGGNQVRAAEMLGMGRNTLRRKLTDHRILEPRAATKRTRAASSTAAKSMRRKSVS